MEVSVTVDDVTHYILAGVPAAYPARTGSNQTWDFQTLSWRDIRTLAQHKSDKWAEIKAVRAAAFDAPLTTSYGVFDSYAEARSNITDAVLLAQTLSGIGQPVAIVYTLADNTTVTLDLTGMVTVGLTLGGKVQAVRAIATALRAQIDAATNIATVEAIQWPAT